METQNLFFQWMECFWFYHCVGQFARFVFLLACSRNTGYVLFKNFAIVPVDPVGEIRALIQNKSNQEFDLEHEDIEESEDHASSTATSSSKTVDDGDLNLKSATSTDVVAEVVTESATTTPPLELTDYDLVIVSTSTNEVVTSTTSTST